MKRVLISGGSSGIGEALVQLFKLKNFDVISLDKEKPSSPVRGVNYEIGSISDEQFVQKVVKKYDSIDLLINNAAVQFVAPLKEQSVSQIKEVIDTNAFGTLLLTKLCLEKMHHGLIINIGSVHSTLIRTKKIPYDFTKAGIRMFTKELALELEEEQTRVIGVEFGAVKTPMNSNFINTDELKSALSKQTIPHLLTPKECAELIYQLTTDTFQYMNGSILVYDCGRSLK